MVPPSDDVHSETKERSVGKVGNWLAGILAGIIVGCAVWYFTKAPAPPVVTTFEGMVYSKSVPVPKAMVAVEFTGEANNTGPVHDFTDDNGSYRIDFTGLPKGAGATVRVSATGFKDPKARSVAGPLEQDIHVDFPLEPVAEVHLPTPSPVHGPVERPIEPAIARAPVYIRKGAAQATQIKIQPK
jgi:hypothetical protein